jgi:hypothetical protein
MNDEDKKLDFYASEVHYADHIVPVWNELPEKYKGTFFVASEDLYDYCANLGVSAKVDYPKDNLTLVASYGDYKKTAGPVVYMEHGIGHTYSNGHPSYAGSSGKDRVVLFLCQHELTASKNQDAYPDIPSYVIGTPKMDAIEQRPARGRTVAISFHWDAKVAPETRSAFSYYRPILKQLMKSQRFKLIGHSHPRVQWRKTLRQYFAAIGLIHIDNFSEILEQADVYVIDNSSSAYEFAAAGRHVILLNAPWYRRDVNHGIRFWDYLPGPMVDKPVDLKPTIIDVLDNPEKYEAQRKAVVASLYPYLGESSSRAARYLGRWLDQC